MHRKYGPDRIRIGADYIIILLLTIEVQARHIDADVSTFRAGDRYFLPSCVAAYEHRIFSTVLWNQCGLRKRAEVYLDTEGGIGQS